MAAPAYQGNGGIGVTDNSATCAVPFPSLQANDILILQLLSAGSGSDTHQTPSGFAEILPQTEQSTNMDVSFWWKRATGTESGNLTCTRSLSSDAFFGIMSCWRGAVTSGTPFNAPGSITVGRSTSATSTSITPSYNYSRVICLLSVEDNLGNGTFAGGNYAENFDVANSTGDDAEFSACSFAQTTAAQEVARAATIGGTDSWATCTIALWSIKPTTVTVGSAGAVTVVGYDPTVTVGVENNPTNVACTLGVVTATGYDAVIGLELIVEVGGGGTGKNLWPNADLEAGVDDWNNAYNCPVSQSSDQAYQGTYSLKGTDGGWGSIKSDVKSIVSESTQYIASWYVYPVTTAFTPNGYIYDQGDNVLYSGSMGLCPADTWTRVNRVFTTGAGDTGIAIYMETASGTAKVFYLDAVQVELGGSVTDWENYGATGGPEAVVVTGYDAAISVSTGVLASSGVVTVTGFNPVLAGTTLAHCTLGVVTATGFDATVTKQVELTATLGSVTATGFNSTVTKKVALTATLGAVTVTGINPLLSEQAVIPITAGSVTVTGYATDITTTSGNILVTCTLGSVTVTGSNPLLNESTIVSVGGGVGKNLWQNPSLESGITGWTSIYDQPLSQSNEQAWHGTYSLEVEPVGQYDGVYSDDRSVIQPSTQYILSFYIYPLSSSTVLTLVLRDQDDDWFSGGVSSNVTVTANEWQRLSVTGTSDGTATGCNIHISQSSTNTDHYYLDGFQLEAGASATTWENYGEGAVAEVAITPNATTIELETGVIATSLVVTVTGLTTTVIAGTEVVVSCTLGTVTITGNAATVFAPLGVACTLGQVVVTGRDASIGGVTYYVRADGTAANKAAATSDAAASTSMSPQTHNNETFTAGDNIVISDAGGTYRPFDANWIFKPPSSGASGSPITYEASGSPLIKGSLDISTASYSWTASGSGTNEYYCRTSGGANPSLIDPGDDLVFLDGVSCAEGTIGALADHGWAYGDNDSLGYNTIYIRDDSGDPDTSGVLIEASQAGCFYNYACDYLTIDGLECRHGHGANYIGGIYSLEASYVTIQNCEAHWNNGTGIHINGDHCTIDNCVASYNGSHNLSAGGYENDNSTYMTIKNSSAHHGRTLTFVPQPFDGYGIKFLFVDYSLIYNCSTYSNEMNGIDLDGDGTNPGCSNNEIYNNHVYDNYGAGVLVELRGNSNKVYRNYIHGNGTGETWGYFELSIWHGCQNNEVFNNVIWTTYGWPVQIGDFEDTLSTGTKIYNNTLDANSVASNCIHIESAYGTAASTLIKNNILIGSTGVPISVNSTSYTGFECDYNCYDVSGGDVISREYTGYTIAEHVSAYGQDGNSVDGDPLFKDGANRKYYLTSSSPCIDVGVNLGATYDDGLSSNLSGLGWPASVKTLDQDSWGTGWEVGAYVYDGLPAAGAVTVVGLNPTVILTTGVVASCNLGTVTVTAFGTTLSLPEMVLATLGAVTVTALNPTVETETEVLVDLGAVVVTGINPAVTVGLEVIVACTLGTVTVTGLDTTVAAAVTTTVNCTAGAVTVVGLDPLLTTDVVVETHETGKTTPPEAFVTSFNTLIGEQTAVAASVGAAIVTGYNPTVWAPTGVSAAAGAVSVVGYDPDVSIILDAIPATLGTVTVAAVTPAFAMKDWKRTKVDSGHADVTILGKAASIIAPIIAATLGTVAVTGYTAEIHEAHIEIAATSGAVTVAGHNASSQMMVTLIPTNLGVVAVTGYDAAGTIAAQVDVTSAGAVTVSGAKTIVNALAVWATKDEILVIGHDPEVVAPLVMGESVGPAPSTSKNYISYYQDWAHYLPAPIARRWREFLRDTFYIATPLVTVGGSANSLELTTDAEITQHTEGDSWRFIAAYTNTGGVILDVNNIGPQTVNYNDQPLLGGEIVAGGAYEVMFDGQAWNLTSSSRSVIGDSGRTWMKTKQELSWADMEQLVWSDTYTYDDSGYFQPAGSPIEYALIPANGRYRITANIHVSTKDYGAGDIRDVMVCAGVNGAPIHGSRVSSGYIDETDIFVFMEYVNVFSAGDQVSIWAYQDNSLSSSAAVWDDTVNPTVDDPFEASWWAIERLR